MMGVEKERERHKFPGLDTDEERWTPPRLAKELGVSGQRVRELLHLNRIVGARKDNDRYSFPARPRILRGDPRWDSEMVPGPVTDYILKWEADHGIRDAESAIGGEEVDGE